MRHKSLHIAMIAVECFPYVKVGGLSDVVAALSGELVKRGARVDVFMPAFSGIDRDVHGFQRLDVGSALAVQVGRRDIEVAAYCSRSDDSERRVFLVGGGDYFDRDGVYVDSETGSDYPDQFERWVFFQRAVLALLATTIPGVDVIHCHDHQTGLIPRYVETEHRPRGVFQAAATVLTIHNLAYQGLFDADLWPGIGPEAEPLQAGDPYEFFGRVSFMKGGIFHADALTTVSPTYASEIPTPEHGCGLEGLLESRRDRLHGILNGIDSEIWNPETDPLIPKNYTPDDLAGKAVCREELLADLGLSSSSHDGPVLAMISRIEDQKGFDLLLAILDELLSEHVFFILLGTGDRAREVAIEDIVGRHPDRARARIGFFDERLAHRIEAGADVFLMPSSYEPCGLNQMYSLKYGTVPVVRRTGGLADTVEEFDALRGLGNGFVFNDRKPSEFRRAIDRALSLWSDRRSWARLQRNGMTADFGWSASAERYLEVYKAALSSHGRH